MVWDKVLPRHSNTYPGLQGGAVLLHVARSKIIDIQYRLQIGYSQTDSPIDRETDRQTDRQTDTQTDSFGEPFHEVY